MSIKIKLPVLHADQVKAFMLPARFEVVRCGRRWGKTALGVTIAADAAAKGRYIGWFAPGYKYIAESYRNIEEILDPVKKSASRDGVYSTRTGGRIDFWSLENEDAGRSRKYHTIIIDEGAFTKAGMLNVWRKSIRPTLLDYKGNALVLSNTNGVDEENFLYQICTQPEHGFKEYHAPTHNNPYLPADEIAKLQAENHPLVYQQEYLAEFVDWSGVAFFSKDKLLFNGEPVAYPGRCDAVIAVIDTAIKTGKDNDGTAVSYWAITKGVPWPLILLDWDIVQIEGALLEVWLPTVYQNLEILAAKCHARMGSLGAYVEDKGSGTILLQQAIRRNWAATPIDNKLTEVGKDERAISVSGYVYQDKVKVSDVAFHKTSAYKGITRNHFLAQVLGFRVGDKAAATRADDLLDTFTYAIAIVFGNEKGY